MFKAQVVVRFFLMLIWRLSAWLLMPLLLLFARKTDQVTTHYGQPQVPRYRLPYWLAWAESPDEHLPGGLYEPTVMRIYERFGWFISSWYWLGFRNVGNGIVWGLGHEVPMALKSMTTDDMARYGVWRKQRVVLGVRFIWGWETVRDWHSTKTKSQGFWAVPHVTARLAGQD